MKIVVTSNCRILGQGYATGQFIDASEPLAKEFFLHARARKATPEEIAKHESSGKKARASKASRETAALETPSAGGSGDVTPEPSA
jgi:hypothetical protein